MVVLLTVALVYGVSIIGLIVIVVVNSLRPKPLGPGVPQQQANNPLNLLSISGLILIMVLNNLGAESLAAGVSQQQDNNPLKHDTKCWAEIYMNAEFDKNGSRLLLMGPHELSTLKGLNDQNWDNDIESIIVGPEAYMVLYADQEFGGRTLILAANQTVGNLSDAQMKNEIESLRITCK